MLLSLAVEKYLETGKTEYLNEINRKISKADIADHDRIYKTINTILNNFSEKRTKAHLIGMCLGAFLLYGFYLYDRCCNSRFEHSPETSGLVRALLENLILFAGATGGFLIAEFTRKPIICDYFDRVNILKSLIQEHKKQIEAKPDVLTVSP